MADFVIDVGGMACSGCAGAVEAAIRKAAPSASVTVDLATGHVTVSGAPSRDGVADAIVRAGYDIRG